MYIGKNRMVQEKGSHAALTGHMPNYAANDYAFRIIRLKRLIVEA